MELVDFFRSIGGPSTTQPKPALTINDLPVEIIQFIFDHLGNAADLERAGTTCRLWRDISQGPILWKSLCLRKLSVPKDTVTDPQTDWKKYFYDHGFGSATDFAQSLRDRTCSLIYKELSDADWAGSSSPFQWMPPNIYRQLQLNWQVETSGYSPARRLVQRVDNELFGLRLDGSVVVWCANSGAELRQFKAGTLRHPNRLRTWCFAPNDQCYIATRGNGGWIKRMDLASGRALNKLNSCQGDEVVHLQRATSDRIFGLMRGDYVWALDPATLTERKMRNVGIARQIAHRNTLEWGVVHEMLLDPTSQQFFVASTRYDPPKEDGYGAVQGIQLPTYQCKWNRTSTGSHLRMLKINRTLVWLQGGDKVTINNVSVYALGHKVSEMVTDGKRIYFLHPGKGITVWTAPNVLPNADDLKRTRTLALENLTRDLERTRESALSTALVSPLSRTIIAASSAVTRTFGTLKRYASWALKGAPSIKRPRRG